MLDKPLLKDLERRYADSQRTIIYVFLDKLAKATRKTGRISPSAEEKIVRSFDKYNVDVVIEALQIYNKMDIPLAQGGKGKNEKYVLGIMANRQAERDRKGGVGYGTIGEVIGDAEASGKHKAAHRDEGERLQRYAEESFKSARDDFDCNF